MKNFSRFAFLFLALNLALGAQTVSVTEKEDKPLQIAGAEGQMRGAFSSRTPTKPDGYTVRYIHVSPGPSGMIEGLTGRLSSSSITDQKLAGEFNFPSLNITLSAASRIVAEDSQYKVSGQIDSKLRPLTELLQMCVNVKLTALDANRQPIRTISRPVSLAINEANEFVREFGQEPILTLGIAPYEHSAIQRDWGGQNSTYEISNAAEQTSTGLKGIGLGLVATFLSPLGRLAGGVAAVFKIAAPTKNLPSQISYQSAENEFGWVWRERQDVGIEGIYRCMALLRTHKSVKYILAEVELITEWKRFGAWVKPVDFIVPVVAPN